MLPKTRDTAVTVALSIRQGRRVSPERSKLSAPNPFQKYTPNAGRFTQRTKIVRLGLKHQLTFDFRRTLGGGDFSVSPDKLGNETGLEGPSTREFIHLSGLLVKMEGSPLNLLLSVTKLDFDLKIIPNYLSRHGSTLEHQYMPL